MINLKQKLLLVSRIWKDFIRYNQFCLSTINYTKSENYFSDIITYFHDVSPLIYTQKKAETFSDNIQYTIGFMQSIFIQQDFIQELLEIFNCKVSTNDLWKNIDYSINREIRNELVGHPISRDKKNKSKLVSSVIFGNTTNEKEIVYLRYHIDKRFEYEKLNHQKSAIIDRHNKFLVFYLDIIIIKMKSILASYKKEILKIEKLIPKQSFENLLNSFEQNFEGVFNDNPLYTTKILREIFKNENRHPRYKNVIEVFVADLKQTLKETRLNIQHLVSNQLINDSKIIETDLNYNSEFYDESNEEINDSIINAPISYELQELSERNDIVLFKMYSSLLIEKRPGNILIAEEIENMRINYDNTLEYFCSYQLIAKELEG
jgi:hypothetical protein